MPFVKIEDNTQKSVQPAKIDESKRLSIEEIAKLKKRMELLRTVSLFVFYPALIYVFLLVLVPLKNSLGFLPFAILVISLLSWYASHAIKFVKAWENAPLFRFGKMVKILEPGLRFMRYPFEKVIFVQMWEREKDLPEQAVDTIEGPAKVDIRIFFKVTKADDFLVKVKDPIGMVAGKAQGGVTTAAGSMTVKQLLTERTELANNIKDSLNADVLAWGMEITQVRFDNVKVPEDVLKARENLARAQTDKQTIEVNADAQLYKVQKEADAERYKLTAEAEGKAKGVELQVKAFGPEGAKLLTATMIAGMVKQGDKFFIDPETIGLPLIKEIFGKK